METPARLKSETATALTAGLSLVACALYGAQQASSNQAIGDPEVIPGDLALPLAFATAAFPAVIVWLMWHFQDTTGSTLHTQYFDTPGVIVFQSIMVMAFWVFIHHVVVLYTNGDCTICDYPRVFDKPVFKVVLAKAFWIHIGCAGAVSLIAPFQFIEKVLKFNYFIIHRNLGRVVLVASVFHQASASVMLTMQLFGNEVTHFHSRWHFCCYISSFGFFNVYTWTAIIKGWTAIRRNDVPTHGSYMMRLGSMWLCVVVYQRCIVPVAFWILPMLSTTDYSLGNAYIVVAWGTLFVGVVPVELYLKYSGRFEDSAPIIVDGSSTDDASLSEDPASSLYCPFLASQEKKRQADAAMSLIQGSDPLNHS